MSFEAVTPWLGTALDAVIATLLACVLHRLGRDPERAWREREERLAAIVGDLRLLVAQGEGQARDLDEKLAARGEHIERLLRCAADVESGEPRWRGEVSRAERWRGDASCAEGARGGASRAQAGRPAPRPGTAATAPGRPAARAAGPVGALGPASATAAVPAGASLLERVRVLHESGVHPSDIAGRVGISVADARMLAALVAARGAERETLPA